MSCHQLEISVGREQGEVVPATELREERVDGADLDATAATGVPQLSCLDVVDSVRNEERQRFEALDDCICTAPTST